MSPASFFYSWGKRENTGTKLNFVFLSVCVCFQPDM